MKDACTNFPIRLHQLLDTERTNIVVWTASGCGFRVNDFDRFRDEILPKYYKHTKLTSFQRQLNLYGFKKINHGEDMGAYYHPLFIRGKRDLLKDIKRSAIKTSATEADMQLIARQIEKSRTQTNYVSPSTSPKKTRASSGMTPPYSAAAAANATAAAATAATLAAADAMDKKRNLFSQMDQCRDAQFKSNFHQSSYPWRQMLDPLTSENPEELLAIEPADDAVNSPAKRDNAENELKFDFDYFFDTLKDSEKEGAKEKSQDAELMLSDEEWMMLLEC